MLILDRFLLYLECIHLFYKMKSRNKQHIAISISFVEAYVVADIREAFVHASIPTAAPDFITRLSISRQVIANFHATFVTYITCHTSA